jgi:hypothetical protein
MNELDFCGLIQEMVGQIISTINEGSRRFSDRHETLSNAFTDHVGTRHAGLELHKTGYHVLVYYVNTINTTRNVDISPELGAMALLAVPCAIRPAVCHCAEFRLMRAIWLAVNAI